MHQQHSLVRAGLGLCLPHKRQELLTSIIASSGVLVKKRAYAKDGITLRQEEKTRLECNCVLTNLPAAIFLCYCNYHGSEASSVGLLICHRYLFPPPRGEGIGTTEN